MAQDATTLSKRVRAVRSHSSFKFCAASISVVHTFQFALPPLVIWCLVWFGVCVLSRVLRLRSWRDFWRPHSLFQHSVQYRHHWACPMCLYGTLCWPGGGGVSWWFGGSCHSFKCWDHSWWAFGCLGCQSWNNSIFLVSEQLHTGLVKIIWTYVVAEFRQSHQFTIYFWSCRFSFVNNFRCWKEFWWLAFQFMSIDVWLISTPQFSHCCHSFDVDHIHLLDLLECWLGKGGRFLFEVPSLPPLGGNQQFQLAHGGLGDVCALAWVQNALDDGWTGWMVVLTVGTFGTCKAVTRIHNHSKVTDRPLNGARRNHLVKKSWSCPESFKFQILCCVNFSCPHVSVCIATTCDLMFSSIWRSRFITCFAIAKLARFLETSLTLPTQCKM